MLVFENYYTGSDKADFLQKVNDYSYKLGIDPNWLMYVMKSESGLNPAIANMGYTFTDGSHAVGLIQFTTKAFKEVGYTGDWKSFQKLSGSEQMDWVYKYFKKYSGKIKSYKDLYLITFYPVFLGRDPSTTFPYSVVAGNRIFDVNGDGTLTIQEFYDYLDNKARENVPSEFISSFFDTSTGQTTEWNVIQTHQRDIVIGAIAVILVLLIIFVSYLLVKSK